jgi:hypothetical protein
MRFMMLYKPGKETVGPPSVRETSELAKFIDEMTKAGILLATDGLQPSALGARVSHSDGRMTVTEGPFAETKDLIAGFAIIRVNSKAEAVELAKRFLAIMHGGESEIRQMHESPAYAAAIDVL